MDSRNAWNSLRQKFTSGNDVLVTRAMITREEYEALLKEFNIRYYFQTRLIDKVRRFLYKFI